MKNKLGITMKKVVFAFSVIYGVNILLKNTGISIPINLCTIFITSFLGVPGLLSIFVIFYLIK